MSLNYMQKVLLVNRSLLDALESIQNVGDRAAVQVADAALSEAVDLTAIGVRVVVAICPICGSHVEWQGNDYGYLCQGPVDARHSEADAVPTAGTFYGDVADV